MPTRPLPSNSIEAGSGTEGGEHLGIIHRQVLTREIALAGQVKGFEIVTIDVEFVDSATVDIIHVE
jgi:hypothetical protein